MSLMTLYQDQFQDIRDFRDQYMAIRRMCDELGFRFGRCTEDAKALLKEQGNDSPTTAQLKKALDKIEYEHHAIIFLYKADKTRYGKYVKQVENNMLENMKDPFQRQWQMPVRYSLDGTTCTGITQSTRRQMMESLSPPQAIQRKK